jgi:hypothetical protein
MITPNCQVARTFFLLPDLERGWRMGKNHCKFNKKIRCNCPQKAPGGGGNTTPGRMRAARRKGAAMRQEPSEPAAPTHRPGPSQNPHSLFEKKEFGTKQTFCGTPKAGERGERGAASIIMYACRTSFFILLKTGKAYSIRQPMGRRNRRRGVVFSARFVPHPGKKHPGYFVPWRRTSRILRTLEKSIQGTLCPGKEHPGYFVPWEKTSGVLRALEKSIQGTSCPGKEHPGYFVKKQKETIHFPHFLRRGFADWEGTYSEYKPNSEEYKLWLTTG